MQRVVRRTRPGGKTAYVSPFHLSMQGMEKLILCRDDQDYNAMVKILCVCARRKNVIVIIYAVVSNHCHVAVLAENQAAAHNYGCEIKRMYSMWFQRRYGESKVLESVDIKAILLDNDWYVRNALAYIPRNALDNGCNVNEYNWSGIRAMFSTHTIQGTIKVSSLGKRAKRNLMHTGDNLDDVPWLLDSSGVLVPSSFCDVEYFEQVFNNDLKFFLRILGSQNSAEMDHKLVEAPRKMLNDTVFLKDLNEISDRWFKCEVSQLSKERKKRLIPYIFRTKKTTVHQLARAFQLDREEIAHTLKVSGIGTR